MQALGSGINFANSMTGKTEAMFRLMKVGETYFNWGHRITGVVALKNAEQLFKTVTAFQNLYRVFKALNLYNELDKVSNKEWKDGGLKVGTEIQAATDAEKQQALRAIRAHRVFSILSPTTLLVVSMAGFSKFLGERQILPISAAWSNRLANFGKYGGGYIGNTVAALSGALGSWNMGREGAIAKQKADALPQSTDSEKKLKEIAQADAKKKSVRAAGNAYGSIKYAMDLGTTALEEVVDSNSVGLSLVKAVSRHTALVQSSCEPLDKDLWTPVQTWVSSLRAA